MSRYLIKARDAGFPQLLEGLFEIFTATNSKRKYFCLLRHLEMMGLLKIPAEMNEIMARPGLHGINNAARKIQICTRPSTCRIVYVQPNRSDPLEPCVITFQEFARVVQKHNDPVSQRFAKSLSEWAEVPAGKKRESGG